MAFQITLTGDVGRIAAAANEDSSIKWYCYERPYGGGTSIYVQREIDGILQAEVRFLAEGENPEIFFDPVTDQWIFTYVLNENLWMIAIDENDSPITQSAQAGTVIDHYRLGSSTTETRDTRTIAVQKSISIGPVDIDDSPRAVEGMGVVASSSPGTLYNVRWICAQNTVSNQNLYPAGFNIYVRTHDDRELVRLNSELIPFVDYSTIYETEVRAIAGTYYVTQVSYKGDASTQLQEARIKEPSDEVFSTGTELPTLSTSVFERLFGQGRRAEDITLTFVETLPVSVIRGDVYQQTAFGEGNIASASLLTYGIVQVQSGNTQPITDTYRQSGFGEGLRLFLSGSDFGSVIVG